MADMGKMPIRELAQSLRNQTANVDDSRAPISFLQQLAFNVLANRFDECQDRIDELEKADQLWEVQWANKCDRLTRKNEELRMTAEKHRGDVVYLKKVINNAIAQLEQGESKQDVIEDLVREVQNV